MSTEKIIRTFAADLTPGEGRTVDVRIIPYGEQIEHNDGLGDVPRGEMYREEWAPGVFAHQEKAAHRIFANAEHEQGIGGVVGHGVTLREGPDGFYGSFKLHDNTDGNKALMLIKEGVFDGVSLEAIPVKSEKTREGVVRRIKAHLQAVAFTRFAAYSGAQVLAVREQQANHEVEVEELPNELLTSPMDPELVERARELGIDLPERYQAQPAPDTSTQVDTSESDTRQTTGNHELSEANDGSTTERA